MLGNGRAAIVVAAIIAGGDPSIGFILQLMVTAAISLVVVERLQQFVQQALEAFAIPFTRQFPTISRQLRWLIDQLRVARTLQIFGKAFVVPNS